MAGTHGEKQHQHGQRFFPLELFAVQHQGRHRRRAEQQAEIHPVHQIAPAPDEVEIGGTENRALAGKARPLAQGMFPRCKPQNQDQQQAVDMQIQKEAGDGLVEQFPHALAHRRAGEQRVPGLRNGPHGPGGENLRVKVVAVVGKLHVGPGKPQRVVGIGHGLIGGPAVVGIGNANLVKLVVRCPRLLRPGPFVHGVKARAEHKHQHIGQDKPPEAFQLFPGTVLCRKQIPERAQAQYRHQTEAGQKLHVPQQKTHHGKRCSQTQGDRVPPLPLEGAEQQGHPTHGTHCRGLGVADDAVDIHPEE